MESKFTNEQKMKILNLKDSEDNRRWKYDEEKDLFYSSKWGWDLFWSDEDNCFWVDNIFNSRRCQSLEKSKYLPDEQKIIMQNK